MSRIRPSGGVVGVVTAVANSTPGAVYTITTAMLPSTRTLTLSANLTVAALPTPAFTSGAITLVFKQPASGGPYTVTFPATLEWPGDAPAPGMPTAFNAELVVQLVWTGVNWRAVKIGEFYP